ncbi:hypothetical protein LVB87_11700 [Lysobacter sp. KIS68-7]|uniref:hypothetical protein n=1 Tax=Lysobacter sp. KIS68-7 TaxID=2904252 RepID=UPI001E5184E0|nr:hypothetical protein [Lysobacter sp. KIS68-7]UHQ18845.1 hypothetical protein LVB87_11700 [Lysobacter sp. KIS68-7]
MNDASQGESEKSKSRAMAISIGFVAAFVTAVTVSLSTPDGNLVVTLVPALAVGLVVFGLTSWRTRKRTSNR